MTIEEFLNQDAPYFCRAVNHAPPDDWPAKGSRAYPLADQIRDYVRGWPNGADTVARKKAAGVTVEAAPVASSEPKPLGWQTEKGFHGHKCLG